MQNGAKLHHVLATFTNNKLAILEDEIYPFQIFRPRRLHYHVWIIFAFSM